MNNYEINKAYISHRGVLCERGNINNASPLMHYFLMDCAYQVFCSELQNLPLRQIAAKHRNRMRKGFHDFFAGVHIAFNGEQLDYLLDQVDAFQKHIHNSVEMCKVAAMDCFTDGSFEERLLTSNIWLVNALAADAADYMAEVYHNRFGGGQRDKNIDAVLTGSRGLAATMKNATGEVSAERVEALTKVVNSLAHRICDWVVKDFHEQEKS